MHSVLLGSLVPRIPRRHSSFSWIRPALVLTTIRSYNQVAGIGERMCRRPWPAVMSLSASFPSLRFEEPSSPAGWLGATRCREAELRLTNTSRNHPQDPSPRAILGQLVAECYSSPSNRRANQRPDAGTESWRGSSSCCNGCVHRLPLDCGYRGAFFADVCEAPSSRHWATNCASAGGRTSPARYEETNDSASRLAMRPRDRG